MLEGLEVSEVQLSNLERTSRFDSEFYSKLNIKIINQLTQLETSTIDKVTSVSDGNHMSVSDKFQPVGVPYYRGKDIHNYFIEDSNPICIDYNTFSSSYIRRSHLKKGDVLLSIVGTIGEVAIVSTENNATCNCKLAILRPQNINGFFLSIFLKSKYGQNQIQKFKRGAVQMGLILEDMSQIYVPVFSEAFQTRIESLIQSTKNSNDKSKQTYTQAENLLLAEIGLQNFSPSTEAVNIKSFTDSFSTSGRLDAEYYQPKYEQVVNAITAQNHDVLVNIVDITKSIEPGSANYDSVGLPFLRVADYSKFGLTETQKYLKDSFVIENKDKINQLKPKKGTILFSKDGSVGTAYHLREDFEGITSGAILHLSVKNQEKIIPEYLTLVLNSQMVQMQAERDAGGSIILHWRVSEIENVVVPIIDYPKQQQIAELVEQSFALKQQSEHLLEVAKRAVEIAIEENEGVALAYVESEVDCE